MIYVKIHRSGNDILLAACDKEVLGNTLTDGEFCLNVDEGFYEDMLVDVEELAELMAEATIANLTGNEVVEKAVELGFVDKDCVMEISGVKHAQVVNII
ncbi:MAG: DUF424 family protein [Candidatus Altiarchaeales archaeon]|nr:DUF424 family protein [Candidatus Altiarchaeota archaeon]MCG2782365.1 DUF424 family protein [Candidatus Altiarchaeales archaeon]